jgi:potassium-transporting ATPase ATP-binding subunit
VFTRIMKAFKGGAGPGQPSAPTPMHAESAPVARLLDGSAKPAPELVPGDVVVIEAGEVVPGDGTVIDGIALIDESAITGESAPVIRESGSDRCMVTGGTRVVSNRIVVEVTRCWSG